MRLRIALSASLVIAVVMIVGTLAIGLPGKTAGVKRLTDTLRPAFTPTAVHQERANFNEVQAMATQLDQQVAPALAKDLHLTPAGFNSFLGTHFPAVATGVSQFGTILPRFNGLVTGIQQQQGNFHKADAIALRRPVHLGPRIVPWLLIIPGALVLLLALAALLQVGPWTRVSPIVIAVIGAILIIAPFAVSVPAKAKAVDQLTAAFAPALAPTAVHQTVVDMNTVQAMSDQLEGQLLPALATKLKVTPTQLQTSLQSHFPAFARGVKDLPAILPQFQGLVKSLKVTTGADFQDASSIPWASTSTTTLTWLFVIPGALLVLAGGLPLLAARQRSERRSSAATSTPIA